MEKGTLLMEKPPYKALLEALLYLSENPLGWEQLRGVFLDLEKQEFERLMKELQDNYNQQGSGLNILEVAGGYLMGTRPDLDFWISKYQKARPQKLSRAALETLSIIAYKQPITRAEIEALRGVGVDSITKSLLKRRLIRVLGRKSEPGRPLLYGTTKEFLQYFGLRDLSELPTLKELDELGQ